MIKITKGEGDAGNQALLRRAQIRTAMGHLEAALRDTNRLYKLTRSTEALLAKASLHFKLVSYLSTRISRDSE